ncbi:hypothetical protein STH12_01759 [Shewanella khirikhana]|uniref:Uncharacterized protein n=1 Tax=Shewanella khirikhana TaxID=1965282 RepID=A0ABM7DB73_9GAMM|nr:hypothetical protein STH12_01759 [Shewanella khirikhana]
MENCANLGNGIEVNGNSLSGKSDFIFRGRQLGCLPNMLSKVFWAIDNC